MEEGSSILLEPLSLSGRLPPPLSLSIPQGFAATTSARKAGGPCPICSLKGPPPTLNLATSLQILGSSRISLGKTFTESVQSSQFRVRASLRAPGIAPLIKMLEAQWDLKAGPGAGRPCRWWRGLDPAFHHTGLCCVVVAEDSENGFQITILGTSIGIKARHRGTEVHYPLLVQDSSGVVREPPDPYQWLLVASFCCGGSFMPTPTSRLTRCPSMLWQRFQSLEPSDTLSIVLPSSLERGLRLAVLDLQYCAVPGTRMEWPG